MVRVIVPGYTTLTSSMYLSASLAGTKYNDVLQIYGMSRAGYIPQLFSLRLPNSTVIFELLSKTNAKALVYDASFESLLAHSSIPGYLALGIDMVDSMHAPLPEMPTVEHGDQTVLIQHTSGSTSGSPKLVPCSATWMDAITSKAYQLRRPKDNERQDVGVWM